MPSKIINAATEELISPVENKITQVFLIGAFTALTAIGARIEIPNYPVPYTLQTFFVLLAGPILGKRSAAISMGLYLLLGAAGLPVFSGGTSGLFKILGPSGGYLLSFPIAAYAVGLLTERRHELWWIFIAMITGSLIYFSVGTIQLNILYIHNWLNSVKLGFIVFSWLDAVKIAAASIIACSYLRKAGSK